MDINIRNTIENNKMLHSINKQKQIEQSLNNNSQRFNTLVNEALGDSTANKKPIDKKLMDVCVEMESLFVNQMIKAMRKTLNKENDLLHGGMAQEIFEDMLFSEYAKKMSQTAHFGIAQTLYDQLSRKY